MKHISILTLLLLLFLGFITKAQPNTTEFSEVDIRNNIRKLIIDFGKSVDLYHDPDIFDYEGSMNRENTMGYNMFIALFDTVNYTNNVVNFIDPRYIATMIQAQQCKTNQCIDQLFNELVQNKDYKSSLSLREYVETYREFYLTKGISSSILEGGGGTVDSARIIWNGQIKRSFGNRFVARASAPFSFWGVYLDDENQQTNITMENVEFVFDISFDRVKSEGRTSYANFKINKVGDYIHITDTIIPSYVISITPFAGVGNIQVNSSPNNNAINEAYNAGSAWSFEAGLILERKVKPFNRNYLELVVGTGAKFKNVHLAGNLMDGYFESNPAVPPFNPSASLQQYSLNSVLTNSKLTSSYWLLGIPFNAGLNFPLKQDNSVRGYFRASISYMKQLSAVSEADGMIDYSGIFVYNNNGTITQIEFSGENTPFPQAYGKKDAYTKTAPELESGVEVESQIGLSFQLGENSNINVGGYFITGSLQLKNDPLQSLIEPAGIMHSAIESFEKLNYISFGLKTSVTIDFYKLKRQK